MAFSLRLIGFQKKAYSGRGSGYIWGVAMVAAHKSKKNIQKFFISLLKKSCKE
jgi:hypothetical protein